MHKRWSLALVASLVAVHSFAAGRHSSFLTGGPEGGPILEIVFSPADPNIVLACGYYGSMYHSEDAGHTWTRTTSAGALGSAFTAAFDPLNPSVVYAGVTIGVGRSTDSGKTWTLVAHGLPENRVSALFVDPAHSGTVLAGTTVGLYRTTDSGANWSPFGTGLPAGLSVNVLSGDPTNPQTLLASAGNGVVFRSTNGGASWGSVFGFPNPPFIYALEFDPATPGRAYAGSGGVYRSNDHGATWKAVSDDSFRGTVSDFAFLPGAVLVATNEDIEKSSNGGVSWTALDHGMPERETFFNAVAVSPGPSPIVLAGAETNGVVRSTDGGANWGVAKTGLTGNVAPIAIAIDSTDPKRAVAALAFSGGVRTTDGGRTWTTTPDLGLGNIYSIVAVPGASGRFVAGSGGVFYSTNGGATWQISPSIPDDVYAVAVGTSGTHPLFAGTNSSGVWRSNDSGATWHPSSAGLPALEVDELTVGPAPTSIVYAGLGDGSVWRSTDSGSSWHPIGSPDSSRLDSLAADPNHSNVLYAGTGNALYKSTDGGSTWSNLSNGSLGFTGATVYGIALPAGNPNTVFVAIYGGGAFVSHDGGATWGQIDPHFPRVLYSNLATTISTDATGEWIYEGSLGAGVFVIQPARIDAADETAPKKVRGGGR